MLQALRGLSWRDGLFSLKTFVGAMLALFIALRLDLSQPAWAVTTVYVVSQPFAGMVLAKSIYRVLGTLIGAVASMVFVALFSDAPELFCLVLALWIGAGTAVSIYLRDEPRAYVGMLSGYSAAIIGLPAALAPTTAFDFAVARCLEIILGIGCGTLMHHVVFPQRAGDALRKALQDTLPSMARWVGDALRGQESEAKGLTDRRKLISSVVALDSLRVFAYFDTPSIRSVDPIIRRFEGKLLSLLAILVSVYDRFALVQENRPATAAQLRPLLERVAVHIATSAEAPTLSAPQTAERDALVAAIDAALPTSHALRGQPDAFIVRSILLRTRDVLARWHEAVTFGAQIAAGDRRAGSDAAPAFHPYRDVPFAFVGGAISAITVLAASAFWILTAWPNGPTAITFAGVMCAIMASRDDPVSAATTFLKMSVVGAMIAALYLFVVLPPLNTFPALVIALAPLYLFCGLMLAARPPVPVMPVIFVGGGLIGLSNTMTYDPATFINSAIGYWVGIGIGALALGLLRPIGAEWAVQRLTRGLMADLARAAGSVAPEERASFESRTFDRINALFVRLDPLIDEQRAAMQGSLAALRLGLNMLLLREIAPQLPRPASSSIAAALDNLAEHFGRSGSGARAAAPLPMIKAARDGILSLGEETRLTRAAEALYSIEMTLRQHADFFGLPAERPPVESTELASA